MADLLSVSAPKKLGIGASVPFDLKLTMNSAAEVVSAGLSLVGDKIPAGARASFADGFPKNPQVEGEKFRTGQLVTIPCLLEDAPKGFEASLRVYVITRQGQRAVVTLPVTIGKV